MNENKCPKCGGEMEEGFFQTYGGDGKTKWGTKNIFLGLENKHDVKIFRCKSCGFLESYAK